MDFTNLGKEELVRAVADEFSRRKISMFLIFSDDESQGTLIGGNPHDLIKGFVRTYENDEKAKPILRDMALSTVASGLGGDVQVVSGNSIDEDEETSMSPNEQSLMKKFNESSDEDFDEILNKIRRGSQE